MQDFEAYPKIENIRKLQMCITQKIHGTNGQIRINKVHDNDGSYLWAVRVGSRTRWLTPEDDNYGFCKWVGDNFEQLIAKLGEGTHYGEWCGLGINSGEGLARKMFVLFDWWRYADSMKLADGSSIYPFLMEGLRVVPVLYKGDFSEDKIAETMQALKDNGSHLTSPGSFMRPEGVVISVNGTQYKSVFQQEETAWKRSDKPKIERVTVDVSHLLQPIRLEKLLSRDERYKRHYPESLRDIVGDYAKDLQAEGQYDAEDINLRKSLGAQLYPFVRHFMETYK